MFVETRRFTRPVLLSAIALAVLRAAASADAQDVPAAAATVPASAPAAPTGAINPTFAERCPQSILPEIKARLRAKDLGADYDLSKEPFFAYVPPMPAASGKYGVMVYLNYKDTIAPPDTWEPSLDKQHLIFVSPAHFSTPPWQQVGLALDAVHNLAQQYPVDADRVYVMGIPPAEWAAFYYPDVFHGAIYTLAVSYVRNIVLPSKRFYKAEVPRPDEVLFGLAKRRPQVVAPGVEDPADIRSFENTFKADGFPVLAMAITRDDIHYPHPTVPWFEQAVDFLDHPPGTQTGPKPTVRLYSHEARVMAGVDKPLPGDRIAAPSAVPPAGDAAGDADVPAAAAAPVAPGGTAAPASRGAPSSPPATPAVGDPAAHVLSLAQSYATAGRYDLAREKLQKLLLDYPDSPLAPKARAMLSDIAAK